MGFFSSVFSDPLGTAGDLVGSAVNTVTNIAGDALEPAVKVGEWSLENPLEAAALAAGAYYGLPALAGAGEGAAGLSALDAGMGVYPTSGLSEAVGGLGGWDAAMADLAGSAAKDAPSAFAGLDQETANLIGLGDSTPAADSGIFGAGSDLNKLIGLEGGTSTFINALSKFLGGGQKQGTGLTGMGALTGALGLAGIMSLLNAEKDKYGVPGRQTYTGPLSQYNFNPSLYQPTVVDPAMFRPRPGTVTTVADQMARQNMAKGGTASSKPVYTGKAKLATMQPWERAQAELANVAYKAQMPVGPEKAAATNVQLGQLNMARGGISDLGSYSDGGRMLNGPGDGMSDSIPATIGGKREARLADGEFVVPADVVSHLGNGSTDAGARQLYKMMDRVRNARTGTKKQGKEIDALKQMPA